MAREKKDSGIEWIGREPEGWNNIKLCYVSDVFLGITPVYSEEKNTNYIIGQKNNQDGKIDMDGIKYAEEDFWLTRTDKEFLTQDDILLNSLGTGSVGRVGIWKALDDNKYITDGHILVIRAKREIVAKYLYYSLWIRRKELEDMAVGSTNQAFLTVNKIYKMMIPLPTYEQQIKISLFLDEVCTHIDSVIEQTSASIEEYKKLKQAVITQAVTKGIRPDRQMKDSGIEWIGEIPSDWTIMRKLVYAVERNISYGIIKLFDPDDENGVKVLRCSDVREGFIDSSNIRTVTKALSEEYHRTVLDGGEVVINVRGTLGGCAVVPMEMKGYNIAREVAMVCPDSTVYNRYLMYYFLSDVFVKYQSSHLAGSVYIGLNIEMLSACPFTLPPLSEQKQISDYLDAEIGRINDLISKKEIIISELETYKKSLIYEYVTGKKEVPA